MAECLLFKHGLVLSTKSIVKPCCIYKHNKDENFLFTINDFRSHFDDLYEKSKVDWLPGCYNCKTDEDNQRTSMRQRYNRFLKEEKSNDIKYLDLKLNNTCNLLCVMCSPEISSTWKKVYNKNKKELEIFNFGNSLEKYPYQSKLEFVTKYLNNLNMIKFTGGEPMLIKEVKTLINYLIDNNLSNKIILRMITNGTVELDDYWKRVFKSFKRTRVTISVDAINSRYEYIRKGASWDKTAKNIKIYNDYLDEITIEMVSMSINARYKNIFLEWCYKNNYESGLNSLIGVDYLSYKSLNNDLRAKYGIETNLLYDHTKFLELEAKMKALDKIYNTAFEKECDEFYTASSH